MPRQNVTAAVTEALRHYRYWLAHAKPGAAYAYHHGLLAADRFQLTHVDSAGVGAFRPVEPFHSLAQAVLESATQDDYVSLYQKRLGPAEYLYVAVRNGKEFSER